MKLEEYRKLYNNDPVFTIIDKVNETKAEFAESLKDKTRAYKHQAKVLGKFFYFIFMHNVALKYVNMNENNEYGFLICTCENYKKISRYYRTFIDYLADKKLIFYPLNSHSNSPGKVKFRF